MSKFEETPWAACKPSEQKFVINRVADFTISACNLANSHLQNYLEYKRRAAVVRLGGELPARVGLPEPERSWRLFLKNHERAEVRYAALRRLAPRSRFTWIEERLSEFRDAAENSRETD